MSKKAVYKAVYHLLVLAICLTHRSRNFVKLFSHRQQSPSHFIQLYRTAHLVILTEVINLGRSLPQTKQGFICGDPSLSLLYKPNSYPTACLSTINYIAPFLVVVTEIAIHGRKNLRNLMVTTIRCLMWIQQYFFVYILFFVTMQYIKSISGFLRPHFLTECMPDLAINCTKGEFIESDYVCTNPNVRSSFARSFPSANTMTATYPMIFIIWYLQQRLSRIPLLVPILATIATWWVLFASITRITDHAHHTRDVIGAFIILSPYVVYLNLKSCKNFKTSSKLDVNELQCLGIIKCTSCKETRNK